MRQASKFIIYQILLRVFGNTNENCVPGGSLQLNGTGKFSSITPQVLDKLKDLAVTHVWYTGVIEHATKTSFEEFGICRDNPLVIKGEAGSPYAIKDYYDVNPYLADSVSDRMAEFEALVERTHKAGLKAIIDFVPNHLARTYNSDSLPQERGYNPYLSTGLLHKNSTVAATNASATDSLSLVDSTATGSSSSDASSADVPIYNIQPESFGETDNSDWAFSPQNNFYYLWGEELDLSEVVGKDNCREEFGEKDYCREEYVEKPAKATGNDCFSARPGVNDWYETVKLNYGVDYCGGGARYFEPRPKTWDMMLDVLLFWASKGVDGFRCDMAEMVPVEFWHWAIDAVKRVYPQVVFIAEVYNPSLYDSYMHWGGFDYLYDKVGLYDNLKAITQGHAPAHLITGSWQSIGDLQYSMLNFLENHDEQRVASDFNIGNPFKAIPELAVSLLLNTAPFMLYFGQEFGERGMLSEGFSGVDGRTSIFDYCSAPSVVRFLNSFPTATPSKPDASPSSGTPGSAGVAGDAALGGSTSEVGAGTSAPDKSASVIGAGNAAYDGSGSVGGGLLPYERRLYAVYRHLFALAMGEEALRCGSTYDLEYANFSTEGFDPSSCFAFARKSGNSIIIVAVDFTQKRSSLPVNLPQHLFDFWAVQAGHYSMQNLSFLPSEALPENLPSSVYGASTANSSMDTVAGSGMDTVAASGYMQNNNLINRYNQSIIVHLYPDTPIHLPVNEYGVAIVKVEL